LGQEGRDEIFEGGSLSLFFSFLPSFLPSFGRQEICFRNTIVCLVGYSLAYLGTCALKVGWRLSRGNPPAFQSPSQRRPHASCRSLLLALRLITHLAHFNIQPSELLLPSDPGHCDIATYFSSASPSSSAIAFSSKPLFNILHLDTGSHSFPLRTIGHMVLGIVIASRDTHRAESRPLS
jgi:hypothetical protein